MYNRFLLTVLLTGVGPVWADQVDVAVASNFAGPIKSLATAFTQATGHTLNVATGASGKFFAQIQNGAPFEVLLSADDVIPAKLEQEHLAVPGTRFTYAVGRLVLWSAKPGFVDERGDVLKKGHFEHIALANPKLAPYGAAAMAVMNALGVSERLSGRLVLGENIAQTQQFIASGNAELGFIAVSQVEENGKLTAGGSVWKIPVDWYPALRQDAVLLNKGQNDPAALAFMKFLAGDQAKSLIKTFGYE